MLASFDTEFTDLVMLPGLLSVSVVAERGINREFCAPGQANPPLDGHTHRTVAA